MAKKPEFLPEKRQDLLLIDPRSITVDTNYNTREDYKDMASLIASIKEHGVEVPMMVRRDPTNKDGYILIRGHRRLRACMELIASGEVSSIRVPAQLQPRGMSEIDSLVDQHTSNTGEPLNTLEMSTLIGRLLKFKLTPKEISTKLFGTEKSLPYVMKCIRIKEAPEDVRDMIRKTKIAATEVARIFSTSATYEDAVERLRNIDRMIPDDAKGGAKATQANINAIEGRHNSVQYLKKVFLKSTDRIVRKDRKELYDFTQKLIDGEFTAEDLEKELFEPLPPSNTGKQLEIE